MPSATSTPHRNGHSAAYPSICIIGAGFSGICAGIQLKRKLNITNFTIFDDNEDVGGTWLVNSYPGCACDVQSHFYSYSFELNPYWSKNYSSHEEIGKYLKDLAEKYGLYSNIRFSKQVRELKWDETIRKWRVTVFNMKNEETPQHFIFDIVINGPGGLRIPKYPEEFMSFKGPIIHSAKWDPTVELNDKVVAVIGSGASAVQIIPTIANKVKTLHVYQRKPAWVLPRLQFNYPDAVKSLFAFLPLIMILYRFFIYLTYEVLYPTFIKDSFFSFMADKIIKFFLKYQLEGDKELIKKLTPNYTVGCKRIGISESYYSTFLLPNVKLHRNKIVQVTEDSILTENNIKEKIDVLILATGFVTQAFFDPVQLIGKKKENIMKNWKETFPSAFLGIITHDAPNHFMVLGPNTLLGNVSVVFMAECQVNYIIAVIAEMLDSESKCVTVDASAEEEYMKYLHGNMDRTIWAVGSCGSWYTNAKGKVISLWPLPTLVYWWKTRSVDFSKLEFS